MISLSCVGFLCFVGQVTEDHYQALLSFFTKYPNSTLSSIYLAGDGYGGVYAPLLLQKLDSVSQKLPLQFEVIEPWSHRAQ